MYKEGDKVKIREDLEVDKRYNELFFIKDMEEYKGKIATITRVCPVEHSYEIDIDDSDWYWTDDMLKPYINNNIVMTVEDLLNKTDVEKGGLIITIYYPNAYFEATIGHNKINRNSELYKRFVNAYGDMIVDEVSFDIRNENMVVMLIKVDYAD
jgi:hypothetical protein